MKVKVNNFVFLINNFGKTYGSPIANHKFRQVFENNMI